MVRQLQRLPERIMHHIPRAQRCRKGDAETRHGGKAEGYGMSYEYYVLATFPSGYREAMVFDTRWEAEKQAQKYANRGAVRTYVKKEGEA